MDPQTVERARAEHGVVSADTLGSRPPRAAARHGLVLVQPGAFVAATQPVDLRVHLTALTKGRAEREWYVLGEGALWLYGVAEAPKKLDLGIPLGHALATADPVVSRRVVQCVLEGSRHVGGFPVVALEVAVIQAAQRRPDPQVRELVEDLVRDRRTTLARLRSRCRRGLAGSARVRRVCDELAGGSMERDVRRLRAALEALGVTGLESETHFRSDGGASAYADLLHRPTMTVIEVDGFLDHIRRDAFRRDRHRDRWLRRQHDALTLRVDVLEVREDLAQLAEELAWFLLPQDQPAAG